MDKHFDPRELCRAEILGVQPYHPGRSIESLCREYRLSPEQVIKLASNENVYGPSPQVIETLRRLAAEVMWYPEGQDPDLLEALAQRFHLSPEHIVLGNGSNEILEFLGRCFLHHHGAEVVFSEHAFSVYAMVAQICFAQTRIAPAYPETATMPYGHNLEQIQACLTNKTRLVFMANPNNPTGTWFERQDLVQFLERVPEQCVVVIDQAYIEYANPDINALPLLQDFPNLVITQTFSKAYGLAGLRLGYALSSPDIAALLNRVRQPFNVNLLAQKAALSALNDEAYLRDIIIKNNQNRDQLKADLEKLGLKVLPSCANFLCVKTGPQSQAICQALQKRGVIVRPIDNYQLPDFLRITVGSQQQNETFLRALRQVMDAEELA